MYMKYNCSILYFYTLFDLIKHYVLDDEYVINGLKCTNDVIHFFEILDSCYLIFLASDYFQLETRYRKPDYPVHVTRRY